MRVVKSGTNQTGKSFATVAPVNTANVNMCSISVFVMSQLGHRVTLCCFLLREPRVFLKAGKQTSKLQSVLRTRFGVFTFFSLDLFISFFVNMFLTFEVIATFGVSAVVSFSISSAILLLVAAKRGLLRKREKRPGLNNTALLPPLPSAPPKALLAEQTPLQS